MKRYTHRLLNVILFGIFLSMTLACRGGGGCNGEGEVKQKVERVEEELDFKNFPNIGPKVGDLISLRTGAYADPTAMLILLDKGPMTLKKQGRIWEVESGTEALVEKVDGELMLIQVKSGERAGAAFVIMTRAAKEILSRAIEKPSSATVNKQAAEPGSPVPNPMPAVQSPIRSMQLANGVTVELRTAEFRYVTYRSNSRESRRSDHKVLVLEIAFQTSKEPSPYSRIDRSLVKLLNDGKPVTSAEDTRGWNPIGRNELGNIPKVGYLRDIFLFEKPVKFTSLTLEFTGEGGTPVSVVFPASFVAK